MIQADRPVLAPSPALPTLSRPADPNTVRRYITALQGSDATLAAALATAQNPAYRAALLRRRADLDAAAIRLIDRATRRMSRHRAESLATFNAVFKCGHAPDPTLDGECNGRLNTSTLVGPIDSYSRWFPKVWMPWLGKRFQARAGTGDNMFRGASKYVGRLFWPTFGAYHPFRDGLLTAFPFQTSVGPGIHDPEISTLKLDYNLPGNPRLGIRSILDELVQVTDNYYLGKVYLRLPGRRYLLVGFFDLQRAG